VITTDLLNGASAARSLGGLVLVTPNSNFGYQPKQPVADDGTVSNAPPTLLFNYESENVVELQSEITDHYVEDNTAVQDQIALKPEVIRVTGYIGELTNINPFLPETKNFIQNKLTAISGYAPAFSASALVAINRATAIAPSVNNIVRDGVSSWNTAFGESEIVQNKQQKMFQQFYGYWKDRFLFDIQTPWAIFTNMAILSLSATQSGETAVITEFSVTFKKIRKAEVIRYTVDANSAQLDPSNMRGRAQIQGSETVDYGPVVPQEANVPFSSVYDRANA
jgi:hypothetical protein